MRLLANEITKVSPTKTGQAAGICREAERRCLENIHRYETIILASAKAERKGCCLEYLCVYYQTYVFIASAAGACRTFKD